MNVILLSAGMGTRLLPLTRDTPKPLLEIRDGQTILDSQLDGIAACNGISETCIVVGYRAEQIEQRCRRRGASHLRFIYNPFFDQTNNLVSLWFALTHIHDDFIIINGDDVFEPRVLQDLLDLSPECDAAMVVDRKPEYDEDDMKVVMEQSRVRRVSKQIPAQEANAESIGMLRFQGTGRRKLMAIVETMVRDRTGFDVFYLEAVQRLIDEGHPVHTVECSPDDWQEIDFHPDLRLIRQLVIQQPEKKRS